MFIHSNMKASICLVIVLLAVSTIAQQGCDPSQYDSVRQCYSKFFKNYKLTLGADNSFPSYEDFDALRGKDKSGLNNLGMARVCVFQNSLSDCIGPNSVCINPTDLLKVFNVDSKYAYSWIEDFFMNNYECFTEYKYTMNNFYCLQTVRIIGKDKLFQCKYQLDVDMNNDICQAEASYATCMMSVYESYCGKDAGVYTCNVVKTGVEHALPQCTSNLISCPKYSFA